VTTPILVAGRRRLELDRPRLMGVVNATPDSFSDAGGQRTVQQQVALARAQLAEGADIIDVGGESGVTDRPPVPAAEEIDRVVPVIERVAGELGALVSVDTYKPEVARAALAAGAAMVNDVSGLRDPAVAEACAEAGAALVVMDTRARPKEKLLDPALDVGIEDDVLAFLRERMAQARRRGLAAEQIVLDPGPDFGKTPHQTVRVLRDLPRLATLGRPLLLAVSRKDFLGAITGRPPRARGAGTLAALGFGVDAGARLLRVHDVAAAADFLAVRAVLRGERELPSESRLASELRREPAAVPEADPGGR
jgi:dihydropteroate synthase